MNPDKSSGFSAHYKDGPKEPWMTPEGKPVLLAIAMYRIMMMIALGPRVVGQMSPEECVVYGISCPKTVFGKDELVKIAKDDKGLVRMIWPSSIIQNFVLALLTQKWNKACISAYQEGICQCLFTGIGHHDEGLALLSETVEKILDDPNDGGKAGGVVKDCESYDFTIARDAQMTCAGIRIEHTLPIPESARCPVQLEYIYSEDQFDPAELEKRGLTQAYCALMHVVYLLEGAHTCVIGGKLYAAAKAGITGSGSVGTTTDNSVYQTTGHRICRCPQNASGGDDNIARQYRQWLDGLYRAMGFRIKEGSLFHFGENGPISFNGLVGTRDPDTKRWTWRFDNVEKLYINARLHVQKQEDLDDEKNKSRMLAYRLCLRHVPDGWETFVATFRDIGIDVDVVPECSLCPDPKQYWEPFVSALTEIDIGSYVPESRAFVGTFTRRRFAPEARRQAPCELVVDAPASSSALKDAQDKIAELCRQVEALTAGLQFAQAVAVRVNDLPPPAPPPPTAPDKPRLEEKPKLRLTKDYSQCQHHHDPNEPFSAEQMRAAASLTNLTGRPLPLSTRFAALAEESDDEFDPPVERPAPGLDTQRGTASVPSAPRGRRHNSPVVWRASLQAGRTR